MTPGESEREELFGWKKWNLKFKSNWNQTILNPHTPGSHHPTPYPLPWGQTCFHPNTSLSSNPWSLEVRLPPKPINPFQSPLQQSPLPGGQPTTPSAGGLTLISQWLTRLREAVLNTLDLLPLTTAVWPTVTAVKTAVEYLCVYGFK